MRQTLVLYKSKVVDIKPNTNSERNTVVLKRFNDSAIVSYQNAKIIEISPISVTIEIELPRLIKKT